MQLDDCTAELLKAVDEIAVDSGGGCPGVARIASRTTCGCGNMVDMAVTHATRFTVKEYLALEAVAEIRHEFTGGQIVAMAGAEFEHNQIAQNVRSELTGALADRPCHIVGSDQRVYVEAVGEYFYPDVLVTYLEPRLIDPKPRSLVNPQVIVEVLSDQPSDTIAATSGWPIARFHHSLTM